jgi:hypothetical protein
MSGELTTKQVILDMLKKRSLGWNGGLTSFDIAQRTGKNLRTIQSTLRSLYFAGMAESCAPRKFDRLDGRTASTLVWFKAS